MKRMMNTVAWLGLLAGVTLSAGAAEMKKVVLFNFNASESGIMMFPRAVNALQQAGFEDGKQIRIMRVEPIVQTDIVPQIQAANPDVVISIGWAFDYAVFRQFSCPIITFNEAEQFVDAEGMPTGNVTGVYTKLKDLVYNSYKFLQKVAPLQAGQQAVVTWNPQAPRISADEAVDALKRLNIPLKAVVDTHVYEDWQEAILKYNDDPEVGWLLMGVWPTVKRDGSVPDMVTELAQWQREHQKKPTVTYWDIVVQMGVLCAFAVDLEEVGKQVGEMAARVLKGEDITSIKADYPRKTLVVLNRKTADTIGLVFPLDVLNLANVIYHDWEGKEVSRKSGLK